jgi:hypothetical protein
MANQDPVKNEDILENGNLLFILVMESEICKIYLVLFCRVLSSALVRKIRCEGTC